MLARWEQTITDEAGNRIDQPTVRVEREVAGLPLAVLKSDIDGASPLSNPFTPAAGVDPFFHTQGGFFKITITKGAYSKVLRYVALGTAAALDTPPLSDAGVWDSGTDYVPGQTVQHDGSSYWALVESTAVEPGVTSGWESSWSLLAQAGTDGAAVPTTGLEFPEQSSAPATPAAGTLLVYAKDDQQLYKKDSAGNETKVGAGGGLILPRGRLTLTTGVPVLTSPVAAATVLYYTPYVGNIVPIYDGAAFVNTEFAELSNDLTASSTGKAGPAAATTNSNYDLFVWDDAGTVRLTRGPAWSSSSARGTGAGTTELERVNGLLVNKIAITNGPAAQRGTYVGTIRTNGSSQLDFSLGGTDTPGVVCFWNAFNRVPGQAFTRPSVNSFTYTTQTWQQFNASANNQISLITGLSEDAVRMFANAFTTNTTGGVVAACGIGVNSTTVNSAQVFGGPAISSTIIALCPCEYVGVPAIGWNTFAWLQISQATGTTTWYGDANSPTVMQAGMTGQFMF
jgi:hypothetical protein